MKVYREVVRLMSEGGSGVLVTMIAAEWVNPRKPAEIAVSIMARLIQRRSSI